MFDFTRPHTILAAIGLAVLVGFARGFLMGAWDGFCDWRAGRRNVEYRDIDGNRVKTWRENGEWFARKAN